MTRILILTLTAGLILCAAGCGPAAQTGGPVSGETPGMAATSGGRAGAQAGSGAAAGAVKAAGGGTVDSPVVISKAPGAISLDGGLGDWAGVPRMPLPAMGGKASSVMFCWTEAGLYGAAAVADAEIRAQDVAPYTADSLEVWIEKDFARAADSTPSATQIVFAPPESLTEGEGIVVAYGRDRPRQKKIKCMWKKAPGGYTLEFLIPPDIMAPAKLAPGTRIGFDFCLNDDGKVIEKFMMSKDDDKAFRKPGKWGAAVLK